MIDTSKVEGGWFIAMGARAFLSGPIDEINQVDWDNLLELRAFKPEREIKWLRGGLSEEAQIRIRDSEELPQSCIAREEEYYLDIDRVKTEKCAKSGHVYAIGGEQYRLPDPTAEKMKVQVYYRADDKGFYQPFDFRVVSIDIRKEGA